MVRPCGGWGVGKWYVVVIIAIFGSGYVAKLAIHAFRVLRF